MTSLIKGGAENLHMDDEVSDAYTALHRFMFDFVYTNPKCKSEEVKAKDMIAKLYDYYVHHIEKLPAFYMNLAYQFGIDRAICDYISGMTDGFAIETFKICLSHWGGQSISTYPRRKKFAAAYRFYRKT